MFDFFIKRKEIVLDCFTFEPHVYNFAKIEYAKKYFPDWWKNTPLVTNNNSLTIKHCSGLKNFYNKGIVIPSWFEMEISLSDPLQKKGQITASGPDVKIIAHPSDQFDGFSDDTFFHRKIMSPWRFSTNKKIYFSWTQPTWSYDKKNIFNLCVLPGVIEFYEQNGTNINLLIEFKDKPFKFEIPALTPLVILHPLTEEKIVIKNHLISEKEWMSFNMIKNLINTSTENKNVVDAYYSFRRKRRLLIEKIKRLGYKNI